MSRAPGDGKDGQDAAHRSHCAARASKGISSDAAGSCASVLSAGWNLRGVQRRRAKTGLPWPKGACGLSCGWASPPTLATRRVWQWARVEGQAHRSPRHGGKLSGALGQAMPGPLLSVACGFAGRWPRSAPNRLGRPGPWGMPVPNLEHKHVGAATLAPGSAWDGAAAPRPGASPAWGAAPWPHCRCETNTDAKEASLQCAAVPGHQD